MTKGGQMAKPRGRITQQLIRRREYMEDAPVAAKSKGRMSSKGERTETAYIAITSVKGCAKLLIV